jgi:uncharacterized radical SAM protein YgiQ
LDAKADLLIYGMGEATLVEVARRLAAGQSPREMRDLRGVVYRLGASEPVPEDARTVPLPEYAAVRDDRYAFAEMTRLAYEHLDPRGEVRLVQRHGTEAIVVNPPALPLDSETLDRYYELPFTRREHPAYGEEKVPALEVVRHSIQVVRGCAGGCAFCSLTAHQGRELRSRSRESVVREAEQMVASPDFRGTITDLGGPTANMYGMGCRRPDDRGPCRRQSCLHPEICRHLKTDHRPAMELMEAVRKVEGVDRVFIASGVRTDLAQRSEAYLKMLLRHHVGGHLKTAPEHVSPEVLDLMHKPPIENYDRFARCFQKLTHHVGKPKQYLVPYFLAGLPGSDPAAMIELACYLKRNRLRPRQVQDFIPGPFDPATCMYHTGLDPMTGREVYVPRGARQRRRQRALLQYFLPENDREVREALIEAGRTDLIGSGPKCLIPERPPKGARKGTRRKAPRGAKHRPTGKRGAPPPGKPRPRKKGR